jgi:hypothetical protein
MMSPETLLACLRDRGVVVEAHGDRLWVAPISRVSEAEMTALRAEKPEVLRLLQSTAPEPCTATFVSADGDDVACAWRIYSHRLHRELWLYRDDDALGELIADGALVGLPALHLEDVARLRGMDDGMRT